MANSTTSQMQLDDFHQSDNHKSHKSEKKLEGSGDFPSKTAFSHNHNQGVDLLTPPTTELKVTLTSHESNSLHSANGESDHALPANEKYLISLLEERKKLSCNQDMKHVLGLIDKEIGRLMTSTVLQTRAADSATVVTVIEKQPTNESHDIDVELAGGDGDVDGGEEVTLSETVYIPIDEYPSYNFIGRILGPRGMTAKQLEKDTGCRIMIRGRYSNKTYGQPSRPPPPTSQRRRQGTSSDNGRYNGERYPDPSDGDVADNDQPLRVVVESTGTRALAERRLQEAVDVIHALLIPPSDGRDELKRRQLVELAIMNGTYRPPVWHKTNFSCPPPTPKEETPYPLPNDLMSLLNSQRFAQTPLTTNQNPSSAPVNQLPNPSNNFWNHDEQTIKVLAHLMETLGNPTQSNPMSTFQPMQSGPLNALLNTAQNTRSNINQEMTAALVALAVQTRFNDLASAALRPPADQTALLQNYAAAAQLLYSLPTSSTTSSMQQPTTSNLNSTVNKTPFKLCPPPKRTGRKKQ